MKDYTDLNWCVTHIVSRFAAVTLVALVAASTVIAPRLRAQSTATQERLAFDAISIKLNKTGKGGGNIGLGQAGGHVRITNVSLRQLFAQAYDFPSLSQVINTLFGLPAWGVSEHFDVEAEAPGNPTVAQKRLMLQSLLADRFKVAVHHETRQLPVYALVMTNPEKLGTQLRTHVYDTACQQLSAESAGPQPSGVGSGILPPLSAADAAMLALRQFPCGRVVGGLLQQTESNPIWAGGRNVTMKAIAEGIGTMEYIDRPVLDQTALSGSFDFTVEWNTQLQDLPVNPQSDLSGLSLFEAFQDQLGLKLVRQTGPVDVLVIDHVEEPADN